MDSMRIITPNWPAPGNVRAYATTRLGGVGKPPWDSFNLADHVGDAPDTVAANRAILTRRLALPAAPRWLNQVHGNTVIDADGPAPDLEGGHPSGDASIVKRPNHVCAVLTADCLPVLFCHRRGTCAGAAHAGWRGLAHGVLEATAGALDTQPADLLAWLGPCIGPGAFEVGDEVREVFVRADGRASSAFSPTRRGHWLADLYGLARQRLEAMGIREIHGGGFCTWCERERFFSYRRDGVTGRMASLIYLRR
ncbi:MAG: conserved hypothetical protein [Candidatus Kentron sp. G]|nr:MAG: conserved hypothetical protein [Candidatus Kentron sp. G]VFM99101.1 MAG: conserved hypothetical protein [Candidatus Kentron sp. G]